MTGQPPANILLICTDQHRYDALGCYDNPVVQTPVIDGLAAAGVQFERCYTPSPVCSPTRASLLTGQHPNQHGLWANGVALPRGNRLLGRILSDAGYRTGLVGRMHLAACVNGRTEPRFDDGFDLYEWSNSPTHRSPENRYHHWLRREFPRLWLEQLAQAAAAAKIPRGGREAPGLCEDVPVEAHYSRWVADQSIRFLREERAADRPFFLVANFFDPHHPFVAPTEYLDRHWERPLRTPMRPPQPADGKPALHARLSEGAASHGRGFTGYSASELQDAIAAYYAMISLVDDEIGRILAALAELGLDDGTPVIFTSDHGEMLGDHGQMLKGPLFYEAAVRVPLILRWPGRITAGIRRDELVQSLDIFATCLAAGVPAEPQLSARDLLSEGSGRPWPLSQYRNSGYPLDPPVHATMLRTDRHKLVAYHGPGAGPEPVGELYDLEEDPDELTNLWHRPGPTS